MFPTENVISEAQLNANRANSQLSTGPTTEEGKKRSSINARRHGLTGQFQAFSEEDRIAFDKHCTELIAEFHPQGARERILAIAIAEDHWRLSRARAIENNIFAVHLSGELGDSVDAPRPEVHTSATHAKTWLQEAHSIQLLTLYESRIRRTIEKNEKQLAELQAIRQQAVETDIQNAILLTELAEFKGESYDPAQDFPTPSGQMLADGFVFSTTQIAHRRDLNTRLAEALHHKKNGWVKPISTERTVTPTPKAA